MKAAALLLLLSGAASAQETAQFLTIGVGARALGMGGAYTAVADDASAPGWNPAGVAGLTKRELGLTHAELATGARYDYAAFVAPLKIGAVGVSGVHLSQAALDGRDAAGRPAGGFSASDSAVALTYGSRVGGPFKLGGSVKLIQSALGSDSASTAALDLGGQYALSAGGPGTTLLGAAVQNVGRGLRFADQTSPLPLTVAVGAGYRLPAGLLIAADYKQRPAARTSELSVGTEYALWTGFSLRAGYGSARAASTGSGGLAAFGGMAGGFGLILRNYSLDYSITPFGDLGQAQRFSLGARF